MARRSYKKGSSYKSGPLSEQDWKNLRILFLSLTGTGIILVLFYLFLINVAPNIDLFWRAIRPGTYTTPEKLDRVPPAPPQLQTLPQATNEDNLTVSGFAEPGIKAVLYINESETSEVVVDKEGEFSFESIDLTEGENKIKVEVIDDAGNKCKEPATHTVILDQEDPDLDVTEPEDGAEFEGEEEKTITVKGTTEPGVELTVNDYWAHVEEEEEEEEEEEGDFEYSLELEDGENKIEVIAKDEAGNETKVELTVTYDAPDED